MVSEARFPDIASRFESLVHEFRQTEEPEERNRFLLRMSETISELDGFVQQYLDSVGLEPATKAQEAAVLFTQQFLKRRVAAR